jgi:basic amino acid/polyamine antiporter, APA family
MPSFPGPATLSRVIGPWAAIAVVVGTTIGSGIFLVPTEMINAVGSPRMVAVVWIVGGFLSLFGALTYAELAAALPEAGGEYVYLREAYGPFLGFLYGWTQTWVAKSASIATLATAFAGYFAELQPSMGRTVVSVGIPIGPDGGPLDVTLGQLFAMGLILVLGVLNSLGVRVGANVQIVFTLIKVGLIAAIILIGLGSGVGRAENYATSIPAEGGVPGFFVAMVAALWAYDGWNNVAMVASEVKDPQRNLPRALIGGTLAIIAIYLLANLAYFYVLSSAEVGASERVAGDMMRRIAGDRGAQAVGVAVMLSIFAALNGSILSGSRVPYALARDGLFFRSFSHISTRYQTPSVAIILLSLWSSVLVLSGRYKELFTLVIFPSWILYALATAAVIVLRIKRPDLPRPYRTLGYPVVPIAFVLVAIALIYSTLIKSPRESCIGLAIIAAGVPFYWRWRHRSGPSAKSESGREIGDEAV